MDKNSKKNVIVGFFSIFISLCLLTILLILITKNYVPIITFSEITKLFALGADAFQPEPLEKLLFFKSIITFPLLLLGFSYLFYKKNPQILEDKTLFKYYNFVSLITISIITILLIFNFSDKNLFYIKYNMFKFSPSLLLITGIISVLFYKLTTNKNCKFVKNKTFNNTLDIFSFISIATVLFYSVFDMCINYYTCYAEHFNAVFDSVVQTYYGKGLLIDFINQYGLYPFFLLPVFKVIGLNVINYSFIMASLIALSFSSIFLFLKKIIHNKFLVIFGISSILFINHFIIEIHPYPVIFSTFMIRPLRLLFPALSIYLIYKYLKSNKHKKLLYNILFFIFSLGIFWNIDSGLVVFFAWLLLLFYEEFCKNNLLSAIKNNLLHVLNALIHFISVFGLINIFMYLQYGNFPNFLKFFESQKYFYFYGFGMMPMHLVHPWNLLALIYIIGLIRSIQAMLQKTSSARTNIIFYLSILGIGVFSYYQGRSHDLNLLHILYPALLILIIITDEFLTIIKRKTADFYVKLGFSSLLILFIGLTVSFYCSYPRIYKIISINTMNILNHDESKAQNYTNFIKKYSKNKEQKIFFLSYNSGYFYLAAQRPCPLDIPGLNELFLKKDIEKIKLFLQNQKNLMVFVDVNFISMNKFDYHYLEEIMEIINKSYKKIDSTSDGNITLYTNR